MDYPIIYISSGKITGFVSWLTPGYRDDWSLCGYYFGWLLNDSYLNAKKGTVRPTLYGLITDKYIRDYCRYMTESIGRYKKESGMPVFRAYVRAKKGWPAYRKRLILARKASK